MKVMKIRIRRWILVLLVLVVFGIFISQLMRIQIVDAEYYRQQLEGRHVSTQTIKAVRGEITDRNGTPLAANRMGYDVIIDLAFFPSNSDIEEQNEVIYRLIQLFEQEGEEWNDTLPVSHAPPFLFKEGYEDEVSRVKKFINVLEYDSTADDVMYWLSDKYKLSKYTPDAARKIVGIRYDMEQRGFNMKTPYTFSSGVSIGTVVKVKESGYKFPGIEVVESASRYYPVGDIAPHIIGTIGFIYPEEYEELKQKGYAMNDVVGKDGVEGALESFLRGKDGSREIYTDSYSNVIEAKETEPPIPGNTVKLTLDMNYQRVAQESIEAQIKYLQDTAKAGEGKEADTGAAVMVEIGTGKLLAAATYPSYDLNTYKANYSEISRDPLAPFVDRALTGLYAPGSTFKPAVAITGLRDYIIDENSSVFCGHVYSFYTGYQPKCLDFHGNISLLRALSLSCNIYFYDVGRRSGIEAIDQTAKQLGLGESTGIEIYEARGQRSNHESKMKDRSEDWFSGDTLQSAIGQGFSQFTPLQLANYAATIANGGERMKITLVEEIRNYAMDAIMIPFEPEIADTLTDVTPEMLESVIKGMVAASRTGSARGTFANYPVDVAAKTGTPETTDFPNSTFICFAPADDPKVAIAVIIGKGWHGYTGAPVAKALLDEYFGYDDVRAPVMSGPQLLKDERQRLALEETAADAPTAEENEDVAD